MKVSASRSYDRWYRTQRLDPKEEVQHHPHDPPQPVDPHKYIKVLFRLNDSNGMPTDERTV
jgi:hypothetical protein